MSRVPLKPLLNSESSLLRPSSRPSVGLLGLVSGSLLSLSEEVKSIVSVFGADDDDLLEAIAVVGKAFSGGTAGV